MVTKTAIPLTLTKTDRPPRLISLPLEIITIQDVVLDSPAFRSSLEQVKEQSDLFERWLEGVIHGLKQFLDSLSKTNSYTRQLCKLLAFGDKERAFIYNSKVAPMAIDELADTLKYSLLANVKLVDDLNKTILQPLHDFLKVDIKEFKDMRRVFEKTFTKYENHLALYSDLSKHKTSSALREDAFHMFTIQKSYIHASATYFMQIINLKSKTEHVLVDHFSAGLADHLEHLDLSLLSQNSARGMIPGWRQWLDESITTCKDQLERIQQSTHTLKDNYIRQIRPHRSLKRYSISNNDPLIDTSNSQATDVLLDHDYEYDLDSCQETLCNTSVSTCDSFDDMHTSQLVKTFPSSTSSNLAYTSSQIHRYNRQGYLFCQVAFGKTSRYSWARRWFFLKDGWFGQYTLPTENKMKGALVIGDRIPVNSTTKCCIITDVDRRFCFEVSGSKISFFVQSETEKDMQQWIWAIEGAKELHGKKHTTPVEDLDIPRVLLSPKANMSMRMPGNDQTQPLVTLSVSPSLTPCGLSTCKHNPATSDYLMNDLSTISALTSLMIRESNKHVTSKADNVDIMHSERSNGSVIYGQTSLHMGSKVQSGMSQQYCISYGRRNTNASILSSWSVPWLIPGITSLSSSNVEIDPTCIDGWIQKPVNNQESDVYVIWPNKMESEVPRVELNSYSDDLVVCQRDLRRHFAGVPEDEIVLNVFSASLYCQSCRLSNPDNGANSHNDSHHHYTENGHSGTVYMTQRRLWFYSCQMMTFMNALVIPYRSIKATRLEKNLSLKSQGMRMYVDTKETPSRTYCFGLWLEVPELIAERINIATKNATRSQKLDDQALFDTIRCTTAGKIRPKSPTSQIIATTTSNAAVTPLTVQAQTRLATEPLATFEHNSCANLHSPSPSSISSSLSNTSRTSAAKVSMVRQQHCTSPAAGALAAVMEAANEARNARSKARIVKKAFYKAHRTNDTIMPTNNLEKSNRTTVQSDHDNSINSSSTTIATKTAPTKPVLCGCDDHLDKTQADLMLPVSAQALYEFMFGLSCWDQLTKARGNTAPSASKWRQNQTGLMERVLNYTMPNPLVKMKDAEVIDTHQVLKKEDGLCYVMLITTKVPILPYADSFIPMMKFCITYNTSTTCRLVCNIGMKWLKSVMMKGMINRAALKGMGETISALTLIAEQSATQDKYATPDGPKKQQEEQSATEDKLEGPRSTNRTLLTNDQHGIVGNTKQEGNTMESNILTSATILSPQRLVIFMGVALLLLFCTTRFMERPRSPFTIMSHSYASNSSTSNLTRRAVHLVDLESFVTGKVSCMDRYNTSTYQAFKTLRSDAGNWNYRWHNNRHRLIAAELTFTREQLAVMRYELLTAFEMLNGMDQRLLQSEYWTWLLDQRTRCDTVALDTSLQQSDSSHNHLVLCNEINKALNDCYVGTP